MLPQRATRWRASRRRAAQAAARWARCYSMQPHCQSPRPPRWSAATPGLQEPYRCYNQPPALRNGAGRSRGRLSTNAHGRQHLCWRTASLAKRDYFNDRGCTAYAACQPSRAQPSCRGCQYDLGASARKRLRVGPCPPPPPPASLGCRPASGRAPPRSAPCCGPPPLRSERLGALPSCSSPPQPAGELVPLGHGLRGRRPGERRTDGAAADGRAACGGSGADCAHKTCSSAG